MRFCSLSRYGFCQIREKGNIIGTDATLALSMVKYSIISRKLGTLTDAWALFLAA